MSEFGENEIVFDDIYDTHSQVSSNGESDKIIQPNLTYDNIYHENKSYYGTINDNTLKLNTQNTKNTLLSNNSLNSINNIQSESIIKKNMSMLWFWMAICFVVWLIFSMLIAILIYLH